jgi:indolepyruvate ferredoxin oxidoreductase alpha subunit
MMGEISQKVDIATVLRGIGVKHVEKCDPLRLEESMAAVHRAVDATAAGVSALIFESPCIHVMAPGADYVVDAEKCECKECIIKLGCPAILSVDGKAWIDNSLCYGCDLCLQICRFDAIETVSREAQP